MVKVGRKRKRGGGQKSGRESTGSISGGRKQKYSEDSSADEDETILQEAGVMKVRKNVRNWEIGYGGLTIGKLM